MATKKVVFVDTETGGLDPNKHSILSLAAVVVHNGMIEDEFYTLIREEELVTDPSALKINGLSIVQIDKDGVSPLQAVLMFTNFLQKNDLRKNVQFVAHNAPFDVPFVSRLFRLAGKDMYKVFSYRALCTVTGALLLELGGKITLPGGSASLDNLCKYFHIDLERSKGHNALDDAIAGAKVYLRELELIGGKTT